MSILRQPDPVKLLASLISAEDGITAEVLEELSNAFGKPDYISAIMPFEYTGYYREEMGSGLKRRVVSFETLVQPENLPGFKTATNGMEDAHSRHGKRTINIDPGYISVGHLLLATGKPYAHRPYLGSGVYGDLTLIYQGMSFKALEWTYPDYREPSMRAVLIRIREKYLKQLTALKQKTRETV